jgi:hypothetical protein
MSGQIRIEFIFSVVIFCVILFFILSQLNILFSAIITDSESDISKVIATNAITVLLEDRGDPPNWQTNPGNTRWVGLAIEPYVLSKQKITELNKNCSLLDNYNLKFYFLIIYNSTSQILSCGHDILDPPVAVVMRYAFVDNGIGNVTIKVW